MSRLPRFLRKNTTTVYHVVSRTALDGLPIREAEKDYMLELIRKFSKLFFVDVLGFCIMGNHLHLVCRVYPEESITEEQVQERFKEFYGEDRYISDRDIDYYRKRWTSLSEFVKDLKQNFTRYYNKKHYRTGFFWGDRFKSTILEKGNALWSCVAYVELNPIRAGLVADTADYRFCTWGRYRGSGSHPFQENFVHHLRDWFGDATANWRESQVMNRFASLLAQITAKEAGGCPEEIEQAVEQAEKKETMPLRFMRRTRHWSDGVIIGSKAFIQEVAVQHRESKRVMNKQFSRGETEMTGVLHCFRRLRVSDTRPRA